MPNWNVGLVVSLRCLQLTWAFVTHSKCTAFRILPHDSSTRRKYSKGLSRRPSDMPTNMSTSFCPKSGASVSQRWAFPLLHLPSRQLQYACGHRNEEASLPNNAVFDHASVAWPPTAAKFHQVPGEVLYNSCLMWVSNFNVLLAFRSPASVGSNLRTKPA